MQTALSIATSDPTGGAGLQADLQVFRSFGVHGAGVVAGLTIQDSHRVHSLLPVFPSVVLDQLRALLADIKPDAIKIGALGSDDVVRNVLLALAPVGPETPVVLDPILFSSSGLPLLERRAYGALSDLMSRCRLVTPNLREAETLSGRDASSQRGSEDAARFFVDELGAGAVLIKGGHRAGRPDDLLACRAASGEIEFSWLEGKRIDGEPVHGTGCALSSAIAAGLALGRGLETAVAEARTFVAQAIADAASIGSGARFLIYR